MSSLSESRLAVIDWMEHGLPQWLVAAVRPTKVSVPWGTMLRSVIAIWGPLATGLIVGDRAAAVLPALGGLMTIMVDQGGPYPARFRLVGTAIVCGGVAGLAIGTLIHGRGWTAVGVVTAVTAVSSIMSRLGRIGSATGLQLLLFCVICLGPTGTLRPWWHSALEFMAGAAWGLLLLVPGWLLAPRAVEVQRVAAVYHNVANAIRAVGTPKIIPVRQTLTTSINAAYDALPMRYASGGQVRPATHLLAILNASHPVTEAATTLRVAGERPPPAVADTIDRLADVIGTRPAGQQQLPVIPPQWSDTPGALALRESMVRLSSSISGDWIPLRARAARPPLSERLKERLNSLKERLIGGWLAWTFFIRLTSCMLVATVLSEVVPVQRSYWVPLAVAVILKPDYGSVFIRAVQRAGGTIIGALLGAAILAVVPFGPWLLLPTGILAALLPYGKALNFGLYTSFLAPFVVLLVDFVKQANWGLAADRAIDTVAATAVVLLVGYAPWPMSWHAHLPGKFASTLRQICDYMDESLITAWAAGGQQARSQPAEGQDLPGPKPMPTSRQSGLRRQCYRALSDLRVEYQRTLAEPTAVSRRATLLWPAVIALEALLDAAAATAVAISGGAPPPDPSAVRQLTNELRAIAGAITAGLSLPPTCRPLPTDQTLEPVTSAVRSVLSVLTPVQHLPPKLAAESANAHDDLGDVLWEAKRYREAEAAFRAAIHLNPGHSHAHHKLAELIGEQKRRH